MLKSLQAARPNWRMPGSGSPKTVSTVAQRRTRKRLDFQDVDNLFNLEDSETNHNGIDNAVTHDAAFVVQAILRVAPFQRMRLKVPNHLPECQDQFGLNAGLFRTLMQVANLLRHAPLVRNAEFHAGFPKPSSNSATISSIVGLSSRCANTSSLVNSSGW